MSLLSLVEMELLELENHVMMVVTSTEMDVAQYVFSKMELVSVLLMVTVHLDHVIL